MRAEWPNEKSLRTAPGTTHTRRRGQNVGVGPDARAVTVVCPDRAVRDALVACLRRRDVAAVGGEPTSVVDGRASLVVATGSPEDDATVLETTLRHPSSVVLLESTPGASGSRTAQCTVLPPDSSLEQVIAAVVAARPVTVLP